MMPNRRTGPRTEPVKIDYPGLLKEVLPSGAVRWRVRVANHKGRRVQLHVAPDHPLFPEHYHAARQGIQLPAPEDGRQTAMKGSIGWLVDFYKAAMAQMEKDGSLAAATVTQRSVFLDWLRAKRGEYKAAMPQSELVKLRDMKASTPGAADNFVKAVRAMYEWGIARGHVGANPAKGVGRLNTDGKGATAWSVADLHKFRERHPAGTMAHLALTLFMFTACRISDAVRLGRGHEMQRKGVLWLDFQPVKKGSKRVRIPVLPPLHKATRASNIVGATYLLNDHGKPFASSGAFDNKFRDWVIEVGLVDSEGKAIRSSHGIRKAAGELLALEGATQYQIMVVHGHASARTSQIYTDGVDRDLLAAQAMEKLAGMEW